MIIAFDGKNHLYCYNENCTKKDKYSRFLQECTNFLPEVKKDEKPRLILDKVGMFENNRPTVSLPISDEEYEKRKELIVYYTDKVFKGAILISGIAIVCIMIAIFYYSVIESIISHRRMESFDNAALEAKVSLSTLSSNNSNSPLIAKKVEEKKNLL